MDDLGYLALLLRCFLGWIFLTTSVDKLKSAQAFRSDLSSYRFVPTSAVVPLSLLVPAVEFVLALNLLLGFYWRLAALAVAVLLAIFSAAIVLRHLTGTAAQCGCGGLLPRTSSKLTHVAMNGVLFLGALALGAMSTSVGVLHSTSVMGLSQHARNDVYPGIIVLVGISSLALLVAFATGRAVLHLWLQRTSYDEYVFGDRG